MSNEGTELLQTIVVASDFSDRSDHAVEHAVVMAKKFGARVVFVHGIEEIGDLSDDESQELTEFYGRLAARAQVKIDVQVARAAAIGVSAHSFIAVGARWRVILDCAENEDADLIVVGRRSYADQESLPVGTTSQRVFFASQRPVLMVPVNSN